MTRTKINLIKLAIVIIISLLALLVFNIEVLNATEITNNTIVEDDDIKILEQEDVLPQNVEIPESKENSGEEVDSSTTIESGFVRTTGGADDVDVMYKTLEDAHNKTNPISISGAGYDGIFISQQIYEGTDYVRFVISGSTFYIERDEVTLIATEDAIVNSHYENVNGEWVYFSAVDMVASDEYNQYVLGEAIAGSVEGVKYYTVDENTFYTSPEELQNAVLSSYRTRAASLTGSSYFQNLPFNSASNHNSTTYKNYLMSLGYTDSQYYNATNAFTDAQSKNSINSLLLFSFANLESAYGTSTYAYRCNNFFGRGAFDSNPDNACGSFGFSNAYSGIMSQAIFIQSDYFDIEDYRFNGTHVGNKASGMNVYYATDPDWGKKIASIAYQIDRSNSSKDMGYYTIASVNQGTTVYKNSSLTQKRLVVSYSGSISNYTLSQTAGQSSSSDYGVKVILRSKTSNGYEIQLPTPINNSSNNYCTYIKSQSGAYPSYAGSKNYSVATGNANFACNYGNFGSQVGYIYGSSVKILNQGNYNKPEGNEQSIYDYDSVIYEYHSNNQVKYKFFIKDGYIRYAEGYNSSGTLIQYFEYFPNTVYGSHKSQIRFVFNVYSSGVIKNAYEYSNGNVTKYYEYFSNTKYGKHSAYIRFVFHTKSNSEILYAYEYEKGAIVKYFEYYPNTKYGKHGTLIKYTFYMKGEYIDYALSTSEKFTYSPKTTYGNHGKNIIKIEKL